MTTTRAARAFLGMTHTPLLGLNPLAADVDADLGGAIRTVAERVRAWAPDRIVVIGPDHYNGFFNENMPPFCIGTQATAVGDYLTPAGPLNVDGAAAIALATWLMDHDFDIAVSRRMRVDHGFSQNLEQIWGSLATPPVIPVFMNAVAQPGIARLGRCRQLGAAIGAWLDTQAGRTLVIGSGGLSHEPPVPTLAHPDGSIRERITVRQDPTPEERAIKTERVKAAGLALASGTSGMKPLNAAWDKAWMDLLESGRLDDFKAMSEASIEADAGLSAHESKTWLIARAALPAGAPLTSTYRYYREIPVLIAGYGILLMQTAD